MHPLVLVLLLASGVTLALLQEMPLFGVTTFDAVAAATVTPSLSTALRRRRGRPRKFAAPSRAVTLTLPETVIARLSSIHQDLSRAVVALTQRQAPAAARKAAELLVFGKRAIITIRPTPSLEKHAGLQLVPLPDGRAMISFDTPKSLAEVELTLNDALDDEQLSRDDRTVYEGISAILKEARRSKTVSVQRRNIIVLESVTRGPRADGSAPLQCPNG